MRESIPDCSGRSLTVSELTMLHRRPAALEIDMPATRLFATTSVEEHWHALAGPWLRAQAGVAWKNREPTVVLTPSRAESFYLRSRLVDEGVPFLGLRFWTPSDARKFLPRTLSARNRRGHAGRTAAARARLRGTARRARPAPTTPPCAASSANRARFCAPTISCSAPAGIPRATARSTVASWRANCNASSSETRIATQAGLHRRSAARSSGAKGAAARKSARHRLQRHALAAVGFAEGRRFFRRTERRRAFAQPRVFGEEVDQLWISSWEEFSED